MNIIETALIQTLSKEYNKVLGEGEWFSLLIKAVRRFVSGADILSLATDVSEHLLNDFNNKDSRVSQLFFVCKDEKQKNRMFFKFAWLRARRFSINYRFKCTSISGLDNILPVSQYYDFEFEELKEKIISNLKDEYTRKVAVIRLSNPGNFIGIKEIAEQMGVKRGGRLVKAIKKIENICKKVCV